MANNLQEHMYPTEIDNGSIMAPPFEDLNYLVDELVLKVDGHETNPLAPKKQHNIPSVPADAIVGGGSVDEYTTPV
jgi:hypothetical protein